jgi:ATP-dependent Zn protease
MKLSEIESLRRGASVHEAGHAIVAWALGLEVLELRIDEDGNGASCIECDAHLTIVDQIAVAEAGMAAVELLSAPTLPQAGFSDAVKIRNLLDDYSEDQCEHLTYSGRERAREILTRNLTILAQLADALARSGSLDAAALVPFTSA